MFSVISPLSAFASANAVTPNTTYIQETQDSDVTIQWKTKVAKEALKAFRDKVTSKQAINDVKYALELLPNGKKWSGLYEDAVYGIRQNIDELIKWEEVTMANLKDKVAGALYDVGIPLSWARRFADVVIEVLL